MTTDLRKVYKGTIKIFNGHFGFLKSELGDTYFHKTGIVGKPVLNRGDEVEFIIEPSSKKEGSVQAIDISLVGKLEKPLLEFVKPIFGILLWFNEDRGFGLIGTAEKGDYFLHKSNFTSESRRPQAGDVLIFHAKSEKGKNVASQCKFVRDYSDFTMAIESLSTEDNVTIEEKEEGRGYRGKSYYSIKRKQVSLLEQAIYQLLKDRTISDQQKFISDYFVDKLSEKSSQEQLSYFSIIKAIFENYLKNDNAQILSSFFSQHSEFLKGNSDFNYSLWLAGYTQLKDLSYIAKQITQVPIDSYLNPFKEIFKRLRDPNEQEIVLHDCLAIIGCIDSDEKYNRIKCLVSLTELDEKVKATFLNSAYRLSTIERQYQMWIEGYTAEKDLSYIAKQITHVPIDSYLNPFKEIFKRLRDPNEQEIVLHDFLAIIGCIDSDEKYNRIKCLVSLTELDEKVKATFLNSAYRLSTIERQYQMWIEGYTAEKDLSYIAKQITQVPIDSYHNPFKEIFKRLTDPNEQEIVLHDCLEIIGCIDSDEMYRRIKCLVSLTELDEKVKATFLNSAYRLSTIERQYQMWLDDLTAEKDLNYIAKLIAEESIGFNPNLLKEIFDRIKDPNEQEILLIKHLEIIGCIDNEDKYCDIKILCSISKLDAKAKLSYNVKVFKNSNIHYQVEIFLDYFQFLNGDKQRIIISLFKKLDVISFYGFCIELLNPLMEINTHYYHHGFSYLKIFLEKREYIRLTNYKYGYSSIFNYRGILLDEQHFEAKISYFRIITSYIEDTKNAIELSAKSIIESGEFDLISRFLKTLRAYNTAQIQICSDLKIERFNNPNVESLVVELCDTPQLMKFWVYDLIDYFDLHTYCHYYFTLSLEERKIFNKKAKAKMGEEIKNSMLKKREPWKILEKIEIGQGVEIEYYTATWKSIWFGDGFIKICIDNESSFSQEYHWDFSEEEFNLLFEYISGKRLKELKITAVGDLINSIDGLDELEEVIWKIQIIKEIEKSSSDKLKEVGTNRIPVNMLLRNQCIQLLNSFQLKELEPTRVLEKTLNPKNGGIGVDVSLLYSIPINEHEVAIIWESLELEKAKATHIFKCARNEYENILSEIKFYLSGTLKVRSILNSKDIDAIENQRKLRYLSRIEHDNFNFKKWESSLYNILPELKHVE